MFNDSLLEWFSVKYDWMKNVKRIILGFYGDAWGMQAEIVVDDLSGHSVGQVDRLMMHI